MSMLHCCRWPARFNVTVIINSCAEEARLRLPKHPTLEFFGINCVINACDVLF